MDEVSQKLITLVDKMPAFPRSVHQVLTLTADINCSPKDLVKVIEHDPVMTIKILKLVNSAYFGLSRKINSINQAVVFVGLNTIKNLAISIATIGMLPKKNEAGFNMGSFLNHSLATATTCKLLGKKMGAGATELADFFVAGLLHDIGKVVFAQFIPQEFKQAVDITKQENRPLHEVERELLGSDHAHIGAILVEKWQLSPALMNAIKGHHDPEMEEPSLLSDCVYASNSIAKHLSAKEDPDPDQEFVLEVFPQRITQRFEMELEELLASLPDLPEEIEKTQAFIRL